MKFIKPIKVKRSFEDDRRRNLRRILRLLRDERNAEALRKSLREYHERDIAEAVDSLSAEEWKPTVKRLGAALTAELLPYSDHAPRLLESLSKRDTAAVLSLMDAEDALVLLDQLPEECRADVLRLMEREARRDVSLLDSYEEDEFGGRMSRSMILIPRGSTVKGAMRSLIAQAADCDNISTIFVTDADGSLYGAIELKQLIMARSDVDLDSLTVTAFPYVGDREQIADGVERLRDYSEELIPVLSEEGRPVGVITFSEILDMVDEEHEDDYARLAALSTEEEEGEGILKSLRKRLPWLIALLFMGLTVSWVVGRFEGIVSALPLIVSFQSLILGMAGNVGTQSLAVTVRTLGGGSPRNGRWSVILRETRIALLNGLVLGLVSLLTVGGYLWLFGVGSASLILPTAACVGLSMCLAMTVSGFTGAIIPILLERLGFDPAVASGPLITTVNDLVAVVGYYTLAWALLLQLPW